MILCDIGNSNATFYENGKIYSLEISKFLSYEPREKVYFINVNEKLLSKLDNPNFINLEPFFKLNTSYTGLGIDRIAACYTIKNGVVIDAGSAITIDIMSNGIHLGGAIIPGIFALLNAYKNISNRLDKGLNTQISLDCFAQNTKDAISYGILKPLVLTIKEIAKDKNIYFTGGDGEFLSRFFDKAIFDRDLIFRAMLKVIKEKDD